MILVETSIHCDRCKRPFPLTREYAAPVLRTQIEEIRDAARLKGWARFRLANNAPNSDLCRACVQAIQKEKAKS